ncbi:AD domain-containing protein [Trichonephila clavata]|uniref:AD domain-containing protein n=1 Tax=Trichonephila clavata TaxID=2740835 RepID=A0A8X6HSH9_TRICU|nr:AD domain-containing protein [Trichonephila clavata]
MDIDFNRTLKYKDHLMKYVEVEVKGKKAREGWLQCIDPLTGNLILARASSDKLYADEIVIVTGDSVESLKVLRESGEDKKDILPNFSDKEGNVLSEDILERKKRLILWLKRNRLPFNDIGKDEGLVVCDTVTIRPPFKAENCISMNGRVLMMVQKLVTDLPDEIKEEVEAKIEK